MAIIDAGDGRQLEYLVSGPQDGSALLFQVGTPNAGTLIRAVTEPAAALGLRVITYSRPGYGQSTAKPGRTIADCVPDVQAVLDATGVDKFFTLGWSGGGPHALACAALLPDRCLGAATLAGVAPYPAAGIDFLDGMDESNIAEFTAAFEGVDSVSAFLEPMPAVFGGATGESVIEGMAGLLSSVDRAALTGDFADDMASAIRGAVASGIAGWRDDDLAFVEPWGFALSSITVPVSVWQGRKDRMVPFAHGQWLAANIPGAEAHLFATEGHLSLVSQFDTILENLLSRHS
jgi:pimeloyl-ACP methyl ester carboxylesterase